jgi:hypothetical protein
MEHQPVRMRALAQCAALIGAIHAGAAHGTPSSRHNLPELLLVFSLWENRARKEDRVPAGTRSPLRAKNALCMGLIVFRLKLPMRNTDPAE